MITEHQFTAVIRRVLDEFFGDAAEEVFAHSELLQYLNIKTRSAARGSKARGSFANHYALYVLVEDYVSKGFNDREDYPEYEGARFSDLFKRQRELPFGSKLQNHALNHRLNEEFKGYFPNCEFVPILRNTESNRYWVNENLLRVVVGGVKRKLAPAILKIIDAYVDAKRDAFDAFIADCERLQAIDPHQPDEAIAFLRGLLRPNVDARVFEIVSYAILKPFYGARVVYWGWRRSEITKEPLILYKTGRTNANDGGIDFVMRPLGRFFQVTETADVRKYFLDIDKVQRYPITFVVKSGDTANELRAAIRDHAKRAFGVTKVVDRYLQCIEEIINIHELLARLDHVVGDGKLPDVIRELVIQSRLEFNMPPDEEA